MTQEPGCCGLRLIYSSILIRCQTVNDPKWLKASERLCHLLIFIHGCQTKMETTDEEMFHSSLQDTPWNEGAFCWKSIHFALEMKIPLWHHITLEQKKSLAMNIKQMLVFANIFAFKVYFVPDIIPVLQFSSLCSFSGSHGNNSV